MTTYLIPLEQAASCSVENVGGKAAALSKLVAAGFGVPPALCLTTAAFRKALFPHWNEIRRCFGRELSKASVAAAIQRELDAILSNVTVPQTVVSELREALCQPDFTDVPLVIRSSATVEDGSGVSFAGQYSSVLGVQGIDAVCNAVLACWRSFCAPNAVSMLAHHGEDFAEHAMALLVQPLIHAECAGVCYSLDPVTPHSDRMVLEAAWGLGIGVVDGAIATDSVRVERWDMAPCEKQVVVKESMFAPACRGGVARCAVPEERQRAACLSDEWIKHVAQLALAVEQHFGVPQDVEWAVAGNKLWLLQSRPLTNLPESYLSAPQFPVYWKNSEDESRFWTRDDDLIASLPLEIDAYLARQETRVETCRTMGVEKNLAHHVINGTVYSSPVPVGLSAGDKRIRAAAYRDWQERIHRQGQTAWDWFGPEIITATERLRAFDPAVAGNGELAVHLEDAMGVHRRHWMLHPMCWFRPRQPYYDAYVALAGEENEDEAKQAADQLLISPENKLTQLVDGLFELSQIARTTPSLATTFTDPPEDIWGALGSRPEAEPLRDALQKFLAEYGERTGDGYGSAMTIATPTWREAPQIVLQLAAQFLKKGVESPSAARRRAREARDAKVEALCKQCGDDRIGAEFQRQLALAQRTLAVLENHNHYIDSMATGQLRLAVMACADRLVEQGQLPNREAILWLTFDEILGAIRSELTAHFSEVVERRQRKYAEWQAYRPPPFLGVPNAELPDRPPLGDDVTAEDRSNANQAYLPGQAASPGRARGRARILRELAPVPELKPGDILVAENVGPLWTPLFPILGGLVLDGGSLTQHAATTAREYGVPAVVQTGDGTQRITDGAWIQIDGTRGVVEL